MFGFGLFAAVLASMVFHPMYFHYGMIGGGYIGNQLHLNNFNFLGGIYYSVAF